MVSALKEPVQRVLRHVGAAVCPGGRLFTLGHSLQDNRLEPEGGAFFRFAAISFYQRGLAHTESELRAWLEDAGFENETGDLIVRSRARFLAVLRASPACRHKRSGMHADLTACVMPVWRYSGCSRTCAPASVMHRRGRLSRQRRTAAGLFNQVATINKGRLSRTTPDKLGQYILVDYVASEREDIGGA